MIRKTSSHRMSWFLVREDNLRSTPMTGADRLNFVTRAILLLLVITGIPAVAVCGTLDDAAKDFARKIATVLPPSQNISYQSQNASSLQPSDVARVDQTVKTELQSTGVHVIPAADSAPAVSVTLSENWKSYVWTAEIREGDATRVVLLPVPRSAENDTAMMPLRLQAERFWTGPGRILDAGEVADGKGGSWLVLLRPSGLEIINKQTGQSAMLTIASVQSATRDPWGNLGVSQGLASAVAFFLAPRMCTAELSTASLIDCSSGAGLPPVASQVPVMIDVAPAGPHPPNTGTAVVIAPVCGGTKQFLATGAGDYTQPDSVQAFQAEPGAPATISNVIKLPGPITAIHGTSPPRAIVKNLLTGNYEAYRLPISCAQ